MKNAKMTIYLFVVYVIAAADFVSANTYFDDGQTHSINDATYQGDIVWLDRNVSNNPGTHLELLDGGKIAIILPFNKSTITINGGVLNGYNIAIDTHGDNIITINGGSITGDIAAHNNSRIYMNGGSLINASEGCESDIYAYDNGICEVKGGSIGGILGTFDSGKIYLYGSNFSVNGQTLHYGDKLRDYTSLSPLPYAQGFFVDRITGTLQDGSALNNEFWIEAASDDDIIVVPEPATICLFGIAGLILRRRNK